MLWLNGKLQDAEDEGLNPLDRGFLLGDGLFETLAVRNKKILRLPAHLARLRKGCDVLRLPFPLALLKKGVTSLVAANRLQDAGLRLTLSRGAGPRGVLPPQKVQPTLLITSFPLPVLKPVSCVLASVTRRNEFSPLSRLKSLQYLDFILARQEAADKKADEAILLNTSGFVTEATSANLFLLREGRLLTPPLSDGVLPGIFRAEILKGGAREYSLEPSDLESADEIFLTNSLGIRSVVSLDGVRVGKDAAYPIARKWAKVLGP